MAGTKCAHRRRRWRISSALVAVVAVLSLLVGPAVAQGPTEPVDRVNPGEGPCGIAVAETRGGTFVFVGSHHDDTVTTFRLPSNGELIEAGSASLPAGSGPAAVGFAYGRYAIVANQASADLHVFKMRANGRLKQVGEPVGSGGPLPVDMVVAPTGLIAVSDGDTGDVSVFTLDRRGAIERSGRYRGSGPAAGIAMRGNLIWVTYPDSGEVHVLRYLPRRGRLRRVAAVVPGGRPVAVGLAKKGAYVVTQPGGPGQSSALVKYRPDRRGRPQEMRRRDAGLFVSDVLVFGKVLIVATLDADGSNQIRILRTGSLREQTAERIVLDSPPTSMTVAAARVRTGRFVLVNEFGNATTSSFRLP